MQSNRQVFLRLQAPAPNLEYALHQVHQATGLTDNGGLEAWALQGTMEIFGKRLDRRTTKAHS